MDDKEYEHRLTDVESRCKSNTHRIGKLEESTEAINRLATSVEVMATKQDAMGVSIDKLVSKVDTIEAKPTKWEPVDAVGGKIILQYLLYELVGNYFTAV